MIKLLIYMLLLLGSVCVHSQNYQITFTGSGQSSAVETVVVKNISQQKSLTLSGSDILHLVNVVGIQPAKEFNNRIQVYPNPSNEYCRIEFYSPGGANTSIEIVDFTGVIVTGLHKYLQQGRHIFKLAGLGSGIYFVRVTSPEIIYTERIISVSEAKSTPLLVYESSSQDTKLNRLKNSGNIVLMQFNDGERLLIKGSIGDYSHAITLVPTESQTVDFEFIECRDNAGRNYSVVNAGKQTWMSENLAYLPKANRSPQSSITEPHYYVPDYQGSSTSEWGSASENQDYGVLYNWDAAMTGCPTGWHLPSTNEWSELTNYISTINPVNIANQLKSCRQVNSPLGGESSTFNHPRWSEDSNYGNYGIDGIGFSCLPAGMSILGGSTAWTGEGGFWWTSTDTSTGEASAREIWYNNEKVFNVYYKKKYGFSVRCIKD